MRICQRGIGFSVPLTLLFLTVSVAAKDRAEDQGRPILRAAEEHSFFSGVNIPFDLKFNFAVAASQNRSVPGEFAWSVSAEGNGRKETRLASYQNIDVSHGSDLWIKRNLDFVPFQAGLLADAFRFLIYLNPTEDTIERFFTTTEHGVQLRCADLLGDIKYTLCFDGGNNLRAADVFGIAYEYSDYRPVGQRFAPYKIVAKRFGKTLLEGDIVSLSIGIKVEPTLFDPPADSIKRVGCAAPKLPKIIKRVSPSYPEIARLNRQQGVVIISALIASDGSVQRPVVVQTVSKALDEESLKAVRLWKYRPAECGTVPVDFETDITVNFILGGHW